MLFLAHKIKAILPRWNETPFGEDEFYEIVARENISVCEIDLPLKGAYLRVNGKPIICLNATLRGIERLVIMYHELAHHFLHAPRPQSLLFSSNLSSKEEHEAQIFALIAVIPLRELKALMTSPDYEDFQYAHHIIKERYEIFERYRI
jgi:Zn-dependent peptidase ImmA (M78 family)